MLESVDKDIFLKSKSVRMTPYVSAEWNQNLFNRPYFTVAGLGIPQQVSLSSGTVTSVVDANAKLNFTTKSFTMSGGSGSVTYNVTTSGATAYKIILYVKSNTRLPIMISSYAKGTDSQFGSSAEEVSLFGWTKIETFVGSSGAGDIINSFDYTIAANVFGSADPDGIVYFTVPEVYETTYFDYQNNSLWPTDDVFTYFRPGESYVETGNSAFSFPQNYRKMTTVSGSHYMPVSSVLQNPTYLPIANPVPNIKNIAVSDMNPYKYFVSDKTQKSISALYEKDILANKIIIKLNAISATQILNLYIDDVEVVLGEFADPELIANNEGILVLYWTGTEWTTDKWSEMPKFSTDGNLTISTKFKKITLIQTLAFAKEPFDTYTSSQNASDDIHRLHLIEISPRVEIELTEYVQDMSIQKSLDSKNNAVPISSLNTNDASVTLSGMPLLHNGNIVPIFSSQSNANSTVLADMLRKNIKLYMHFNLAEYSDPNNDALVLSNTMIPGGVFYSDTWSESDVSTVSIQAFDVTRYLQSTPVPDYVANLKNVFEIITNLLELAGFTDYDYDSLYDICHDEILPMDLSYFYCNSKDSTLVDTLSEIFLAYQIGAYIDEYGIMKFLSLSNILNPVEDPQMILLDDSSINDGGYNVENKAKVGKISIRYQSPKIRQSAAMQNVTDPALIESASFVYTTANTVLWSQETSDSVGFNYLNETMSETSNRFKLNVDDLLDIFHTFSLNNNGYAVIENEVVSFDYKEYLLSQQSPAISEHVSVKNDLELSAAINKFTKKNQTKFISCDSATITNASGNGSLVTFVANNNFSAGQKVMVSGVKPSTYNLSGIIHSANSSSFTIMSGITGLYISGGSATVSTNYDVTITPTGYITNVKRGLFGSKISEHSFVSSGPITDKNLLEVNIDANNSISSGSNASISDGKIVISAPINKRILVYPEIERDGSETIAPYKTYSTKFSFNSSQTVGTVAGGLVFNLENSLQNTTNAYFVEFIRYNDENANTKYLIAIYYFDGTNTNIIAWADITGYANSIIANFEKVFSKIGTSENYSYVTSIDEAFHLKVVHYQESDSDSGENLGELITVFLNNVEVQNWQIPQYSAQAVNDENGWEQMPRNPITRLAKKVLLPHNIVTGTIFGAYLSTKPVNISGITYSTEYMTKTAGSIREIYATQKPLKERNVSYFFQDREFLNGMVQNQNLFSSSKSYMMQVTPEVVGLNYYDVQYMTPAATSADVNPIQYLWYYFPGTGVVEQKYYQKQIVDEYSLAYSTVLNTGFRARMAIANNTTHMVFLKHDADQINAFTVGLNLWTHEIIAPSDPEIIEKIVDLSNIGEVSQLDSNWIQSREAAEKLLSLISKGIDGFSKDTSLEIFGNPLIQVGDIVKVSYPLAGIQEQKYVVHSVNHSFNQGLSTSLVLNVVDKGIPF